MEHLLKLIKESSMDCNLNREETMDEENAFTCVSYGSNGRENAARRAGTQRMCRHRVKRAKIASEMILDHPSERKHNPNPEMLPAVLCFP